MRNAGRILCLWLGMLPLLAGASLPAIELFWQTHTPPTGATPKKILVDLTGYAWMGAKGEVFRFDGRKWKGIPLPQNEDSPVRCLAEASNNEIWAGLENGRIYRINSDSAYLFAPEEGLPTAPVNSILFEPNGTMWIGMYGEGLFVYDGQHLQQIDQEAGLPSNDIYTLSLEREGKKSQVWAATDQGIGICAWQNGKAHVRVLDRMGGLPDEIIYALACQKTQNWISTYDKGTYVKPPNTPQWKQAEGLDTLDLTKIIAPYFSNEVWAIDQQGRLWDLGASPQQISLPEKAVDFFVDFRLTIWVLVENGNLYHANFANRRYPIPGIEPQALADGLHANLWIGSPEGLWEYKIEAGTASYIPGTEGLNITSLYQDQEGMLWIGTLGQGLWSFSEQKNLTPIPVQGISRQVPILSLAGWKDTLWLGTLGGAFRCELSADRTIADEIPMKSPDGTGISYIYQATLSPEHKICFSTDGHGIVMGEQKSLHILPKLAGKTFYAHCHNALGELFALDAEGRVIAIKGPQLDTLYQPKNRVPLAIRPAGQDLMAIYQDGIQLISPGLGLSLPIFTGKEPLDMGNHLHVHSGSWIGRPGELLQIGGNSGSTHAFLVMEGLEVNLQPYKLDRMTFAYDENHLNWHFTGIWWEAPSEVSFRHRLRGHDQSWIESREQRATYPNLPAGTYEFEVQAGIQGDYYASEVYKVPIRILPPFWINPWLWAASVIFLAISLTIYFRRREKINLKKQEQERLMAENQFETLRSQINPHFLFNAFSTLIDLVEESPPHAVNYINRLSDMFRDVLAYRDKPLISLEKELEILDNYYQLQKERYGDNFTLNIEVETSQKEKLVPPMILQILVENALKHNKVSARFPMLVTVKTTSDSLVISNPIQLRSVSSASTRVGLANIRSRYSLLTEHPVHISDDGALFSLTLPLLPNSHPS